MKYLLLAICCYCFPFSALAAVAVTSTLIEQIEMSPGQAARRVLNIQNNGKQVEEVKIYLEDKDPSSRVQSHSRSSKRWITLSLARIRLAPGEKKSISYSVNAPNNAQYVGTYWSNIIVEPLKPDSSEVATAPNNDRFSVAINTKTRYAIAVMSHFGAAAAKYSISAPKIEIDQAGKKVFGFNVKNVGQRHGMFFPSLDVFDNRGKKIAILKGNLGGAYPQVTKRVRIPLHSLRAGNYKALLSIEDKHTGQSFGTDINLSILP